MAKQQGKKQVRGNNETPPFIRQPVSDLVGAQVVDWVNTANLSVEQKVKIAEVLFYRCSELEAYLRETSLGDKQIKRLVGILIDRL